MIPNLYMKNDCWNQTTILKAGCLGGTIQLCLAQTKTPLLHQGTLTFEDGVTSQEIPVTILTKGRYFGKETNQGRKVFLQTKLIHLLDVYAPYNFGNKKTFQTARLQVYFCSSYSIPTSLPNMALALPLQEEFRLILSEAQSGLSFDPERDGVATQLSEGDTGWLLGT